MMLPGPADMPNFNDYPPPVFVYDPVARIIMAASKKLDWRWGVIDVAGNSFKWLNAKVPGGGIETMKSGGVVYDCLNREMLLIGGPNTPTCRYDRKADEWIDLKRENPGILAQKDNARLAVYDPEHNIVFNLYGGVWRYKAVPVGTKGYFGEVK